MSSLTRAIPLFPASFFWPVAHLPSLLPLSVSGLCLFCARVCPQVLKILMCLHLMRTVDRALKKMLFFFTPSFKFSYQKETLLAPRHKQKHLKQESSCQRETRGGRVEERQNDLQMSDKHSYITPTGASDTKGPVSQVLLQIFNPARQMEHFLNPLALSHIFILRKSPWKVFGKRGGQTFTVISQTFCLTHSSGPIQCLFVFYCKLL